jgi:hypothetical protein
MGSDLQELYQHPSSVFRDTNEAINKSTRSHSRLSGIYLVCIVKKAAEGFRTSRHDNVLCRDSRMGYFLTFICRIC